MEKQQSQKLINLSNQTKKINIKIKNGKHHNFQILENKNVEPVSQGQDQNVLNIVGGKDQRALCQTPFKFPFSVIGILYVLFGSGMVAYGTAFLIGANIALTAAHNIHTRQYTTVVKQVSLILSDSEGKRNSYNVVCAYLSKQYKNQTNDKMAKQFDFALLILQSNRQLQRKQTLAICQQYQKIKSDDQIQIYGYPKDLNTKNIQNKINNSAGNFKLFGCKHFVSQLTERMIIHTVDSSFGQSGSPILKWNNQKIIYEAVGIHTTGLRLISKNGGVRLTQKVHSRINKWINDFSTGKQKEERVMFINQEDLYIFQQKKVQITLDTTTYAWKENKYRQDNANKNVCINTGNGGHQWLCSSDLCDVECVLITIKVHKVYTYDYGGIQRSGIKVGLMDINYKGKKYTDTLNHCVYLNIGAQTIWRPNQQQTDMEGIKCSCQPLLSVPCLIECHLNRQLSKITWHYNGKLQAESEIPKSWKNGKNICGVVTLFCYGDSVEFM